MKGGREGEELRNIINSLGEMSAFAQRLRSPITSFDRILVGCHTLYLLTSGIEGKFNQILAKAMLKVGKKNLFIRKDSGHLVEMAPLCVLDFYVHESCQR
jgi:alpha-tubulin N-acetyltransferase 1